MDVNYKRICRTCLSTDKLVDLFPTNGVVPSTSSSNNSLQTIVNAVHDCYNIKIQSSDECSTLLCQSCVQLVTLFHSSKLYAKSADCYLQNYAVNQNIISLINGEDILANRNRTDLKCVNSSQHTIDTAFSSPNSSQHTIDSPIGSPIHQKDSEEVLHSDKDFFPPQDVDHQGDAVSPEILIKTIGTTIDPNNILDPKSKRAKKESVKVKSTSPLMLKRNFNKKQKTGVISSAEFVARRKQKKLLIKRLRSRLKSAIKPAGKTAVKAHASRPVIAERKVEEIEDSLMNGSEEIISKDNSRNSSVTRSTRKKTDGDTLADKSLNLTTSIQTTPKAKRKPVHKILHDYSYSSASDENGLSPDSVPLSKKKKTASELAVEDVFTFREDPGFPVKCSAIGRPKKKKRGRPKKTNILSMRVPDSSSTTAATAAPAVSPDKAAGLHRGQRKKRLSAMLKDSVLFKDIDLGIEKKKQPKKKVKPSEPTEKETLLKSSEVVDTNVETLLGEMVDVAAKTNKSKRKRNKTEQVQSKLVTDENSG